MHDSLRVKGLIPLTEPYSGLGFTQVAGGGEGIAASVLAASGANAIVDWVLLELRSASDSASTVATRCALLQRDGDIVATDGLSPVSFVTGAGSYFIAVRHRNHLGVMTAMPMSLSSSPVAVDLTSSGTIVHGIQARKSLGGMQVLWAGNAVLDGRIKYTGTGNDRDVILSAIGGVVPTSTVTGYLSCDVTMDGKVKYTGTGNDRDPILQNIGGVVPTNTRAEQLP
jgi:hypothetical protein